MGAQSFYEFGPFRLDPGERRVLCDDKPVALTPKCFDLLVALVENSGHLLVKEELLRCVWPNQFVEESNLSFNISILRKALGDGQNGQRYVETVPKKGFRFVAPVTVHDKSGHDNAVEEETERGRSASAREFEVKNATSLDDIQTTLSPSWLSRHSLSLVIVGAVLALGILSLIVLALSKRHATTPGGPSVNTLAVLPFKPLSADSRDESLEMGMAETLITRLSNVRQIVVRPISAVRKYTDPQQDTIKAGQELQTDAILDGSIQKAGQRVRVTVRLMNVRSGTTLWAEQFDENFTDIFKVQDSISGRVTNALLLKLSGEEEKQLAKRYTDDPEAYQLYLQGEYLFNKGAFNKSLEFYQRAAEKDPNFALAYIGLAESYWHLTARGAPRIPVQEAAPKVKAAVTKALYLDETLAEAHNTLAELKYENEYDWSGAEREFQRAIELNPNVAYIRLGYGWYLMTAGRFDEAMTQIERARELDPPNLLNQVSFGALFYFRRDYDKALDRFQKIQEIEPSDTGGLWWISNIYQQKGMYAEAVESFLEDVIRNGGLKRGEVEREEAERLREIFKESGWQRFLRARRAQVEERSKRQHLLPTGLARICAQLGDKDCAFALLEQAIDERDVFVIQVKIEPQYDSLRSDPRYMKLLQRMNMAP